ncbi:hypothetical protein B0T25DRAFT_571333 [Lasiosphaeria hispida]|uniref:Uncharacterized protein n=1 Tax=Lasiosphaeria hispida TaxID=260671 RepID=A0AAJ0HAV3_9PEZI|nr:hypothetical protein B0T25DRAFT_571333 [Lasiosphaeria hispida]
MVATGVTVPGTEDEKVTVSTGITAPEPDDKNVTVEIGVTVLRIEDKKVSVSMGVTGPGIEDEKVTVSTGVIVPGTEDKNVRVSSADADGESGKTVAVSTGLTGLESEERKDAVSGEVCASLVETKTGVDEVRSVMELVIPALEVADAVARLQGTETVIMDPPVIDICEHHSCVTSAMTEPPMIVAPLKRLFTWLLSTMLSSVDTIAPTIELTSSVFAVPTRLDREAANSESGAPVGSGRPES